MENNIDYIKQGKKKAEVMPNMWSSGNPRQPGSQTPFFLGQKKGKTKTDGRTDVMQNASELQRLVS